MSFRTRHTAEHQDEGARPEPQQPDRSTDHRELNRVVHETSISRIGS